MSISDRGPVEPEYTPPSPDERLMLATNSELSQIIFDALDAKDFDTVKYAMAEKVSIERALGESRWDTFNHHMEREFFGGDA